MNNNEFQYTYSSSQKKELKKLREKYIPTSEHTDKMTLPRKLDKQAEKPGTIAALIMGIIGALVLGVGMVCVMVWTTYFVPGIFIGIAGYTTNNGKMVESEIKKLIIHSMLHLMGYDHIEEKDKKLKNSLFVD